MRESRDLMMIFRKKIAFDYYTSGVKVKSKMISVYVYLKLNIIQVRLVSESNLCQ